MPNVKADLAETPDVVLWLVGDQYLPNKQVQLLALSSRRGLSFFQRHVSAAELITHIHNANYKEI
ncbi:MULTISPECIES: hypothetical protein [Legionella]|uniref:Uncharacterized protein n=1 Tax=Legionella steelei TaxID=947033 RepID=A0A0W0ZP47_9GAMM|nr:MULTISPECIES: hypothetical protein [Legionella]KTD70760.1 hypothetical protein Lste_0538 [Legionella steelei]MBN9227809.1 hypothetical protein [Legionella steelei]OJW05765.1 MAG: hypothetical protein BGO44_02175 [Legionella sp. 39-23]